MNSMVIARSRKLLAYLIITHSVMLVTLLSLLSVTCWSLLASAVLFASFIYHARRHQWLKAKKSVISIDYNDDEAWSLHYSDDTKTLGLNLTSSFVTPQLVILYFNHRYFWQAEVITLVDDAVDVGLFRQLRVYLKSPKTFQQ